MITKAALLSMALQCAPSVAPHTLDTLVTTESSGNPYAIGVVGMSLVDQPKSYDEALTAARSLISQGAQISVGLGQVYQGNWKKLGLTVETAFEPCANLSAAASILSNCYTRAATDMGEGQEALKAAFSCYYSNNFSRGFIKEAGDKPSYLMMVAKNSDKLLDVPAIEFKAEDIQEQPNPADTNNIPSVPQQAVEELQEKKTQESKPADSPSWDILGDF